MSFAAQTKKELTMIQDDRCCRFAEFQALLALNGHVMDVDERKTLVVETENVATARRIYTHVKQLFKIHPEVIVRKKMRLKKNHVYAIRMTWPQAEKMMHDLHWSIPQQMDMWIPTFSEHWKSCCKRAFLRGAFLAAGSVNAPGSASYHLEIHINSQAMATFLLHLMNEYELHAKQIVRKKGLVVYLKEGEKIVEFLNVIGAHQALLKFEDTRILKGMRNQVNRLVNCETANMNKTIGAAVRQLEVIRYIDEHMGLFKLPDHLKQIAELRIRYPEANLQELCVYMGNQVSKSGVNHRFRKLEEIARKIRQKESIG